MVLDYPDGPEDKILKRWTKEVKEKERDRRIEAEVGVMGPMSQGMQAASKGKKDKTMGSSLTFTNARG